MIFSKHKPFLSLLFCLLALRLFAQNPTGINNQAVIRDAEGKLVTNKTIGIQVTILHGEVNGTTIYAETHSTESNINGLVTYVIGKGTVVDGVFADIAWSDGPYFLKTEVDPEGGTSYSIEGTTQFQSVPYAMHAKTAEKAEKLSDGTSVGELLYWNGFEWIAIVPGEDNDVLHLCEGVPTWGGCPYLLTLLADPQTSGSVSGGGKHKSGSLVNVSATAYSDWEFVNWTSEGSVEVSNQASFMYTMPAATITLTASFRLLCDDGNACTTGFWDSISGNCIYVNVNCDDGIPCTEDWCDPELGCQHVINNSLCEDNDPCTQNVCDPDFGCIFIPIPDCTP